MRAVSCPASPRPLRPSVLASSPGLGTCSIPNLALLWYPQGHSSPSADFAPPNPFFALFQHLIRSPHPGTAAPPTPWPALH